MRRLVISSTLLLALTATLADAQVVPAGDSATQQPSAAQVRPPNDSLFRHARRLVGEGNGVAGRALVDSLLRASDPITPAYGDALYWHGVVALTAAEAERDYRRVIVEYPLAYYRDDALLSIAELEQARGDRAGALAHLQRYVREHRMGKERGTAALGAARLAFELRDMPLGCSMLAEARRSATVADVELRNQIDAYGTSRCAGQNAATAVASQPSAASASAPVSTAAATINAPSASAKVPAQPRATPPAVVADTPAPITTKPITRPPTKPVAAPSAPVSTMQPPSSPKSSAPKSRASRPNASKSTTPPSAVSISAPRAARPATPATTTRPTTSYTVQLAAYDTRPPAEALVAKLATRGVKARVSGTSKPFRVRLDFYRTHQEAADVVAALKKRGMVGFVTTEARPPEATSP
jgi:cell division protein FtsN